MNINLTSRPETRFSIKKDKFIISWERKPLKCQSVVHWFSFRDPLFTVTYEYSLLLKKKDECVNSLHWFGNLFLFERIQQGYDLNPGISVRFGTSANHRIPFLNCTCSVARSFASGCLRPSSDVVLLPCRTQFKNQVRLKHGRRMTSESNFWIKFGKQLSSTSSACYTTLARQRFRRCASATLNKIHKLY